MALMGYSMGLLLLVSIDGTIWDGVSFFCEALVREVHGLDWVHRRDTRVEDVCVCVCVCVLDAE
jgi:hypothetical protein